MTCGIYKLTNKLNSKIYIGQSVNIEKRFVCHKGAYNNTPISRAIKKYGVDNFHFDIIVECDENILDELEIGIIKLYDTTNISKGYNISHGGKTTKGCICSEATKSKISKTKKGQGLGRCRPEHSTLMQGDNNPNSKKIIYNDIIFGTVNKLAKYLNITPEGLRYRIKKNLIGVIYV